MLPAAARVKHDASLTHMFNRSERLAEIAGVAKKPPALARQPLRGLNMKRDLPSSRCAG